MGIASLQPSYALRDPVSCAGLTRVSIDLRKTHFSKAMDCRVKPGNDSAVGRAKPYPSISVREDDGFRERLNRPARRSPLLPTTPPRAPSLGLDRQKIRQQPSDKNEDRGEHQVIDRRPLRRMLFELDVSVFDFGAQRI